MSFIEIDVASSGVIAIACCEKKLALSMRTIFELVDCSKYHLSFRMPDRLPKLLILFRLRVTIADDVETDNLGPCMIDSLNQLREKLAIDRRYVGKTLKRSLGHVNQHYALVLRFQPF